MTESTVESSWLVPGYDDISSAVRVGEDLEVTFGNGDLIRIGLAVLGITDAADVGIEPDLSGAAVRVTTPSGTRDISWLQLRVATDPTFARQMREEDANEARRVARRLKALREDRGLSQRDVATLAGMTSPQLSKIESGASDLRVSTVQALLRAMGATLSDLSAPGTPEMSQKAMKKRAEKAGVARDLIDRFIQTGSRTQVPALLERGFGWTMDALAFDSLPRRVVAGPVQFKTTTQVGDPEDSPLLTLSRTVAQIVHDHADIPPWTGSLPDAAAARQQMIDSSGQVSLASMVEWAWERGVAVVPLYGKGGFCAAVLSVEGAPTVILKESRDHAAYWMFDLGHELGHIAHGHVQNDGLVDVDALSPADQASRDEQEREANDYALEMLLDGTDSLIARVDEASMGSHLRFKGAVVTVARQANVNAGLLGVVAAKVLDHVGEPKDRWGSANNLSLADGPPRPSVQTALYRRVRLDGVPELDRLLLVASVLSD